jgi:LysM repeat protein
MGFNVGPASGRSLTSAILTLVAFIAVACVAFAAPSTLSERDLSSPKKAPPATPPKTLRSPIKRVQAAAYSDEQGAGTQEDTDDETTDEGQSAEGVPAAAAAPSAGQSSSAASGGDLSYVIREGDSVGAISAMFHIPAQEIFRHNHLGEDSTLHIGQILRIPNPYTAQVRDLQNQITALSSRNQEQERKLQDAGTKERAFDARIEELSGINRALEHDVTMLPWWRRATTVAVTLATVMLGVALVSLLQWFLIRRRFVTVAGANEKLTRLDQRYRALLGRAELRLQQLYGRRRQAAEASAQARSQEDFELEHLGREVKEVLERELTQLGVQMHPPARRSRFREWLASLGSPVAVRSDRR